jgi:predicted MFS family arabinose efflux permease
MLFIDRLLSILIILGSAGHTLGVLKYYKGQPHPLFWSLCATVLMLVLAAINLLRSSRPRDRGLAWVAAASSTADVVISICFGHLIGNLLDVRAVSFAIVALGLTAFSLKTALRG